MVTTQEDMFQQNEAVLQGISQSDGMDRRAFQRYASRMPQAPGGPGSHYIRAPEFPLRYLHELEAP
jgi:hypothetical protein